MIRSLKKLKIWSRRKKKKKTHVFHSSSYAPPPLLPPSRPAPPPPINCCTCCSPVVPSAPPLPSWLDFEHSHSHTAAADSASGMFPVFHTSSSSEDDQVLLYKEIVSEVTPLYPSLPVTSTPSSYQQYMVTPPAYGVPVEPPVTQAEKSGEVFGCVLSVGASLIRCFCPCFRFRQG